jgi:selenocysteine lyase/cysteine desulfurase
LEQVQVEDQELVQALVLAQEQVLQESQAQVQALGLLVAQLEHLVHQSNHQDQELLQEVRHQAQEALQQLLGVPQQEQVLLLQDQE